MDYTYINREAGLTEEQIKAIAQKVHDAITSPDGDGMYIDDGYRDDVDTVTLDDGTTVKDTWYCQTVEIDGEDYGISTWFTAEEMAEIAKHFRWDEGALPWDETVYTVKRLDDMVTLCKFWPYHRPENDEEA